MHATAPEWKPYPGPQMDHTTSAMSGALFGLSLIVAIGPQNAFVLRKGLNQQHVGIVVAICIISDAVLIGAGTSGVGALLVSRPWLTEVIRIGGILFLTSYATMALLRAARQRDHLLITTAVTPSLATSVSTCLAFTWLNPHVYLDTVVLLGAVANASGRSAEWFAVGAIAASSLWFAGLGYGARFLRPLFVRPIATRLLDVSIAVVMICIAASLLINGVHA